MREKVKKFVLYGALAAIIVNVPRFIILHLVAGDLSLPPLLTALLDVITVVALSLVVLAVSTALVSGGNR